jgi:hypothetical protein
MKELLNFVCGMLIVAFGGFIIAVGLMRGNDFEVFMILLCILGFSYSHQLKGGK